MQHVYVFLTTRVFQYAGAQRLTDGRTARTGRADRTDIVLRIAPHTAYDVAVPDSEWSHPYSRERAAFPLPFVRANKYWPPVSRIDNTHGDRNLICSCPPLAAYTDEP